MQSSFSYSTQSYTPSFLSRHSIQSHFCRSCTDWNDVAFLYPNLSIHYANSKNSFWRVCLVILCTSSLCCSISNICVSMVQIVFMASQQYYYISFTNAIVVLFAVLYTHCVLYVILNTTMGYACGYNGISGGSLGGQKYHCVFLVNPQP